jgi:hypothetical protein
MENEIPFLHHIVDLWGCSCTIENNKSLNERTQGHSMMKPMSKLIKSGLGTREGIKSR